MLKNCTQIGLLLASTFLVLGCQSSANLALKNPQKIT
jgi:hypothetical protein